MFEQIVLHDFQCHQSLTLALDQITTLVGVSDSGKTAVLRALDWVCYNHGKPSLLLRRGANEVSVTLKVDGHIVKRTSRDNAYYVDDVAYKTIGRTMPTELSPLLRMGDDNVQRQHDGLFWFNDSGSALVSRLNRIVDLTQLEDWVKTSLSQERHYKTRVQYFEERKNELDTQQREWEVFRDIDQELAVLESQFSEIAVQKQRQTALAAFFAEIEKLSEEILRTTAYLQALQKMTEDVEKLQAAHKLRNDLSAIVSQHDEMILRIDPLQALCMDQLDFERLLSYQARFSKIREAVGLYDEIRHRRLADYGTDLSALLDAYSAICPQKERWRRMAEALKPFRLSPPSPADLVEKFKEIVSLRQKKDEMFQLLRECDSMTNALAFKSRETQCLKNELREKSGDRCPLCGGIFKEPAEMNHG